jgi:hypothetical protein
MESPGHRGATLCASDADSRARDRDISQAPMRLVISVT